MARAPFDSHFHGMPLAVCWFVNFSCNAHCDFCCKAAEIKAGRTAFPPLSVDDAKKLLQIIRRKVDLLYLSGGEPTIHPHIIDILKEAKRLEFNSVGMSSNIIALDAKPEILDFIDAICVSIHSPDVAIHARNLNVPVKTAERVFDNLNLITSYAASHRIKPVMNCVINSTNLDTVMDMVDFARDCGFLLELVPANDHGRIPASLHQNPEYASLIDQLLEMRRQGKAPHLAGSTHYYKTIRDFLPFRCFPYGVPNIMPDGRLCTPCDISEQYAVNILDHKDLKTAVKASYPHLGNYPCSEGKCFKSGIIERSRLFGMLLQGDALNDEDVESL
jgi:MoaA/NifB/PqqE/SkfB family radical SAM enzyme